MKRAWNAYLVFDWKVGEALGGVLRRFLTFWLVAFVALVVKGILTEPAEEVAFGVAAWLALVLRMYQPRRIFRRKKYASWSVPRPRTS